MLNKLENWIFYIFLFAVPISLRHIFGFEPFNFVEWTAVYVYATDLILLALFGFWFANWKTENLLKIENWKLKIKPADWLLLAFVVVAGISIRNAIDAQTAVFQWVKLLEGVALYFYIKDYALKRFKLAHAFEAIVAGATFQAVIAIAQFMTQGSLGLKYLGESPLAPAMSGIAAFFVDGVKIMRAYGTTPHSNVLALYLFVALGAFYSIAIYQKRAWFWHVCHALILWAFFLTFSRVVIGLWILNFVILLATNTLCPRPGKPVPSVSPEGPLPLLGQRVPAANIKKIVWTTFGVCVAFLVCYWSYVANRSVISSTDEAVQLRVLYNKESLTSGQNVFGLGMGNFVPWLMTQNLHLDREVYQPVHNIYLLIYAEVGIVGIALFILFLAFLLYDFYKRLFAERRIKRLYYFSFALVIVSVLIFGVFDHYLWTIQSGRLIFWLALGLLAG